MSLKVLVVDDERDVALLFRQRFRREMRNGEIDLLFAYSGEEALDILTRQGRTDVVLVLSDINMPGMTGLELLCRIKSEPPPVPVCMMTAYGNETYRQRAHECHCDGYLTKPIDFNALKEQIRAFADGTTEGWALAEEGKGGRWLRKGKRRPAPPGCVKGWRLCRPREPCSENRTTSVSWRKGTGAPDGMKKVLPHSPRHRLSWSAPVSTGWPPSCSDAGANCCPTTARSVKRKSACVGPSRKHTGRRPGRRHCVPCSASESSYIGRIDPLKPVRHSNRFGHGCPRGVARLTSRQWTSLLRAWG